MPDVRTPSTSTGAQPSTGASPPPAGPGLSPLVPVLAPLVVTAILLGFVFSRFVASPGVVQPTAVRFVDATAVSGLEFVHATGGGLEGTPTTLGSGVAVIDYDRDGAPDLFFVNGAAWPWSDETDEAPACALYRNDGHGRFSDVTHAAGLDLRLQGMGAAAGDFDNDGWPDLFVTAVGENRLLRNRGNGTFEDVSMSAGVAGEPNTWSTGAVWLDLDRDGKLDLIVCAYARWPREIELDVAFKIAGVGRSYGAPAGFVSASPAVYRNLGNGRFEEAAEKLGFRNLSPDTKLPRAEMTGVAPVDANGDGLLDVVFLYHTSEPTLYINGGRGNFQEWTSPAERREGEAASLLGPGALSRSRGKDTPGLLDVLRTVEAGGGAALPGPLMRLPGRLGFVLLDHDLDGRVDIFSGGGRAEPGLNRFDHGRPFAASPEMYWNHGDGWALVAGTADAEWRQPQWTRGLAVADFDGDGDEDIVLTQHGGPARLLRNEQRASSAWLKVRLQGTRSPRDGTGARVEVHTPRQKLTRVVAPAMSYLSQSDSTLIFGLGEDARVRRLVILWPSGIRQEVVPEGINRLLTVVEEAR